MSKNTHKCICGDTYTDATNDENNPHGHLDSRWDVTENQQAIQSGGIIAHYANYSVYVFLEDDDDIQGYRRGDYIIPNATMDGDGCLFQHIANVVEAVEGRSITMDRVR